MDAISTGLASPIRRLTDRLNGSAAGMLTSLHLADAGTRSLVVPSGGAYAFLEGLGHGGSGARSVDAGGTGAGGAGEDKIVEVRPGDVIEMSIPASYSLPSAPASGPTTISLNGTIVLSAARGASSSSSGVATTPTAGKYPGQRGSPAGSSTVLSKGGGRLAGAVGRAAGSGSSTPVPAGPGTGGPFLSGNGTISGSFGAACVSIFATYDDALAFANFVYNGAWAA
jgi:hypothetical protein